MVKHQNKKSFLTTQFDQKQFQGQKGRLMLELQKSYGSDSRFKLNQKFKDDIQVEKLSRKFKQVTDKDIYSKIDKQKAKKQIGNKNQQVQQGQKQQLVVQRDRQFEILTGIIPGIQKPIKKQKKQSSSCLIINRFDPSTLKSQKLLKKIQNERRAKQIQQKRKKKQQRKKVIKIEKGIDKSKINLQKASKMLQQLKRDEQIIQQQRQKHKYYFKVNGDRREAFKPSEFKLF